MCMCTYAHTQTYAQNSWMPGVTHSEPAVTVCMQVLQMAWLKTQGPDCTISADILGHLRSFANQNRMRR